MTELSSALVALRAFELHRNDWALDAAGVPGYHVETDEQAMIDLIAGLLEIAGPIAADSILQQARLQCDVL